MAIKTQLNALEIFFMENKKEQPHSVRKTVFRIDQENPWLWPDEEATPLQLTPKAFAVLRLLLKTPGVRVTKKEFEAEVWKGVVVGDANLPIQIRTLRQALGDDDEIPEFIETVQGEGYRFIGQVSKDRRRITGKSAPPIDVVAQGRTFVGRTVELKTLHSLMEEARLGRRQFVMVTGEPGIGKTTLVDVFLGQIRSKQLAWIGHGKCIDSRDTDTGYVPIFAALKSLCASPDRQRIVSLLLQHAPLWVQQMPSVSDLVKVEEVQPKTFGATLDRMPREMASAIEILSVECPLILVLEDLHWSDQSTVELLDLLARDQQYARLLVIGTYRVAEVIANDHPLKRMLQELHGHSQCKEVALSLFSKDEVDLYLTNRFTKNTFPAKLSETLFQATEGQPLFVTAVVEELVPLGVLQKNEDVWSFQGDLDNLAHSLPSSVQNLIEAQVGRLPKELQTILEAASVAGGEFLAAAVAAGLKQEARTIERQCESLVKQKQMLRASGTVTLPDGTLTGRYQFTHALYRQTLSQGLGEFSRSQLHRRIGHWLEAIHDKRTKEVAAELAGHFENAKDFTQAVKYVRQAVENAISLSTYPEALKLIKRGLALVKEHNDIPDHLESELDLQSLLASVLTVLHGYAAREVEQANEHAWALSQQVGIDSRSAFLPLFRTAVYYLVSAKLTDAIAAGEKLLGIAQQQEDRLLQLVAHLIQAIAYFHSGRFLKAEKEHIQKITDLFDLQEYPSDVVVVTYGQDMMSTAHAYRAWSLWHLGYPDQALRSCQESIACAASVAHDFTSAFVADSAAGFYQFRRDTSEALKQAEREVALARQYSFPFWQAQGAMYRGSALIEQGEVEEGIREIKVGFAALVKTGAQLDLPHYRSLLVEGLLQATRYEEALHEIEVALSEVEGNGERYYEAELYRQRAECLVAIRSIQAFNERLGDGTSGAMDAEACFRKAVDVAQGQQAKSWELRATVGFARLLRQQGRQSEAKTALSGIYNGFTEGLKTKDLQEAKALLDELDTPPPSSRKRKSR